MNDDNKYKIPVTLTTLINVPMIANTRMAPLKMDETWILLIKLISEDY